jgi:hypothetical protein
VNGIPLSDMPSAAWDAVVILKSGTVRREGKRQGGPHMPQVLLSPVQGRPALRFVLSSFAAERDRNEGVCRCPACHQVGTQCTRMAMDRESGHWMRCTWKCPVIKMEARAKETLERAAKQAAPKTMTSAQLLLGRSDGAEDGHQHQRDDREDQAVYDWRGQIEKARVDREAAGPADPRRREQDRARPAGRDRADNDKPSEWSDYSSPARQGDKRGRSGDPKRRKSTGGRRNGRE